jgi:hypothetical protein
MLTKLNSIDRRFIYLLLLVSVSIGLIVKKKLPAVPSNQVRDAYAAIEKAPTDKLCLIGAEWSASTKGENGPQTRALLHHLMKRHIKFAIMGFDPQGPDNVAGIAETLGTEYGYVYGRDWVNWGYRNENAVNPKLKALVRDIPGAMEHDSNGTSLKDYDKLPIMKGIKDMNDIGIMIDITPSGTADAWVAFVQGVKNTPFVYSPTAVMAPEAYQYLDSGQMVGMLTGLKGAIEYEYLINKPWDATRQALALSIAHVLIVVLIVVGNLGYLAEKRRKRAEQGA